MQPGEGEDAFVAQFPEVVPALLTVLDGVKAASSAPTDARAVAAVVGTVIFDSWWIVWAWVFSLRKFHLGPSAWGFRRPRLSILWLVPLAVAATIVGGTAYSTDNSNDTIPFDRVAYYLELVNSSAASVPSSSAMAFSATVCVGLP